MIRVTGGELEIGSHPPGGLDEQVDGGASSLATRREIEWCDRPNMLVVSVGRYPARDHDVDSRALPHDHVDRLSNAVDDVLGVVEHEQCVARSQRFEHPVEGTTDWPEAASEFFEERRRDGLCALDPGQVDEADTVGERRACRVGRRNGEAGFADSAQSDKGHHPVPVNPPGQFTHRRRPADQTIGEVGQALQRNGGAADEARVLQQDPLLQFPQVRSWFDAEFLAEQVRRFTKDPQCVCLSTRPIEGDHQVAPPAFPQRGFIHKPPQSDEIHGGRRRLELDLGEGLLGL
ncbi:MAG: hypothetical protein OEO77_02985, partial [Acidimicrobiia bacterium]|nr:hypothetical protein [Acidimicrobiia bacterium]